MGHPRANYLANLLQSFITKRSLRPGKAVHAQIFSAGLSADTFLSNRLIELYSHCKALSYATKVFHSIPHPNVFSWNAIISACSKASDLEVAHQLFDQMPDKNVVSWNTMIGALARGGSEGKALDLYYMMIEEGLLPTNFTFASVLSACGNLMALEDGRQCHGLAVKVGLHENLFVENALLGMYTKCGSVSDAFEIFDAMARPNEVSYTAMMGGLVQSGSVEEAASLFGKMHRNVIPIDPVAVSSIVGACARAQDEESGLLNQNSRLYGILLGQSIQALSIKYGFESDSHVGNSLIDLYAKHGDMNEAEEVFNSLPGVNVVSFNILIAGYGQRGDSKKAINMLKLMQQSGFEPDEVTYISLLAACVKSGNIAAAREMFDKIASPNVTSWNAILSGYCHEESYQKAIELFRKMQFQNVQPDRTTLAVILSSCSGIGLLNFGKQVHAASIRAMLHNDMFVASGLVDMYSKCGHIKEARQVFDRMPERDVVSWNSMIGALALHSFSKEAFTFFKQMRENGMSPTEFSYASVITSCARLSSLPQGRQIHAQIVKNGCNHNIYVGSSLIDMYAKCGDVNEARQFFDSMPMKNIVSWNEMIHGYAQNGCGEKAVELFEYMLSTEEKPNSVTFIAVLTACSHSGMVDECMNYLDSMEKEHGIKPMADHYTCVIDCLGRAGRLKEAEMIIDQMPCKDDPILWEVLLSACAVHGNANLGKQAADQLFRLDPQNSSPYVLLSNIYAALGRWNDASAVRALMCERGVAKDRGYSWIDNKRGVRAFMVDDLGIVDGEDNPLGTMQIGKKDELYMAS
uniref:Pentatricopeptide repeat-containing protein At4g20770 n=1 Tax=Elaeis guineensis var. tenera TaxID=51953 RepID=A0A6J0PJZ4_ELAGV|nr:pentatricopeptide repeat-containing protein At4g20770 [Elaeis guineensis]